MGFNSNMDISFKGFQNTAITKVAGQSSSGLIKMKAYRFATYLTNDANGKHFDDFYKALDKTEQASVWKYVPKGFQENQLIFDVSKFELDDRDIQPKTNFMLNGQDLPLDNDKILPVFSFLAKAIKFVTSNSYNQEQVKYAQEIGDIVQESVVDYIG